LASRPFFYDLTLFSTKKGKKSGASFFPNHIIRLGTGKDRIEGWERGLRERLRKEVGKERHF
jgi:hypothetical protein